LGYAPGDFPVSEAASAEVISLPVFPELTEAQQGAVIDAVLGFYA
jgi:dTDP-4-amino-4,6-dideoxygalactose transaminase